ncbi:sigma-E processing peptidase SpoIIGA [Oceanobacillus sp. CAU 1775]
MSIYLDSVWLLNILLDYMLLALTNKLTKINIKQSRLILGALVASMMVPLTIYFPDTFVTILPFKIMFSMLIIFTTFGFKNIIRFMKLLFMFYFISFSVGGGLIAIHFILNNPVAASNTGILTYNLGFGDPISWLFVICFFPLVWFFTKQRMDKHVQAEIRYDSFYDVKITIKGTTHETPGFVDSGNQLTDPFTKKPVVICDEAYLLNWFEATDWKLLKQAYENWEMEKIPSNWIDSIVVIPYQGVEGGDGFIFAIKPDLLTIDYGSQGIHTKHVLVGIKFGQLTSDASYHCLLQPELIKAATEYTA